MKLAIIAITKGGASLGRRIWEVYPEGADLYLPEKLIMPGDEGAKALGDDLAGEVKKLFKGYKGLAFIMAAGIVVRLMAPLVKDKHRDPAVVVLDEGGQYVISLLSGHEGGANELAEMLAELIGAQPVITTASDVLDTLAVDTLAGRLGALVEDYNEAKKVTAAIVNGESVSAYSDLDEETLAGKVGRVPGNIQFYDSIDEVIQSSPDAALIISPFAISDEIYLSLRPVAVLRPRVLVVGIGCNRGTSPGELQRLFVKTFKEHGLSALSVRNIATISDKEDEAGLIAFAKKQKLDVEFISKEKLREAATPSGPSGKVFEKMGVYGVCEPAALLSAGAETLLVSKKKSKNATIAVAMVADGQP